MWWTTVMSHVSRSNERDNEPIHRCEPCAACSRARSAISDIGLWLMIIYRELSVALYLCKPQSFRSAHLWLIIHCLLQYYNLNLKLIILLFSYYIIIIFVAFLSVMPIIKINTVYFIIIVIIFLNIKLKKKIGLKLLSINININIIKTV